MTYTESEGGATNTIVTKVRPNGTVLQTRQMRGGTTTTYVADSGMYKRATGEEGGTIYVFNERSIPVSGLIKSNLLKVLLRGGNYLPQQWSRRNGRYVLGIVANEVEHEAVLTEQFWEVSSITSFSGEGRVRANGLIEHLRGLFSYEGKEGAGTQLHDIRTSDIGSTTFEKPSWVSKAKSREPKFEVAFVDDGRFVRLRHTGGNAVNTDMSVNIGEDPVRFVSVGEGIGTGETIYFYKKGTDELGYSRGSKPDVNPERWTTSVEVAIFVSSLELVEETISP